MPVMCVTRRDYEGEIVEVRTKMGRRVRCTPDHPWLVGDGAGGEVELKLAERRSTTERLAAARAWARARAGPTRRARRRCSARSRPPRSHPSKVIVRPRAERAGAAARADRRAPAIFAATAARGRARIKRTGTCGSTRPRERARLRGATLEHGQERHCTSPSELTLDERFWRVVGLYLAEGCTRSTTRRARIVWSFHPEREQHLVDEVVAFWLRHGVGARDFAHRRPRTWCACSRGSSAPGGRRCSASGRNELRAAAARPRSGTARRATSGRCSPASGRATARGRWSTAGRASSSSSGTVSDELADGVLRLLGDLGIVASRRIGRVAKSTKDTHWLRISGADQVERAIALVPERDRARRRWPRSRGRPSGSRRPATAGSTTTARPGCASRRPSASRSPVRCTRSRFPGRHTFVTTSGVDRLHNCFPKDVNALKQLAGNSGYHFQLLNAVIEVNELQKRRVIGKLQKHLGSLVGKHDRAARARVQAQHRRHARGVVARAQRAAAGRRARRSRAYDPIAEDEARKLIRGVRLRRPTRWTRSTAPTPSCSSPSGTSSASSTGGAVAEAHGAARSSSTGATRSTREAVAAAGLTYEGIGAER